MAGFGNHFPFDIGKEVKNCESLLDNIFYCNMSSQTLVIAIQLSHRLAVGQLCIGQMVRSFLSLSSTNASKGRVTKGRWYLRLRLQWQQPAGAPLNRKLKFVGSHPAAKKLRLPASSIFSSENFRWIFQGFIFTGALFSILQLELILKIIWF